VILKNNLTIIVKEIITIFDNIAINAIKTMTIVSLYIILLKTSKNNKLK
jgi:hypothetical protein